MLDGSSPWVIGQSVVGKGIICQFNDQFFTVYNGSQVLIKFPLIKRDNLLYMSRHVLGPSSLKSSSTSASSSSVRSADSDWSASRSIIDRVYRRVCRHAHYFDIKLRLEQNKLWITDAEKYLTEVINKCHDCRSASFPRPSRKVSLRLLNRSFNDTICVDDLFLNDMRILHVINE